MVADITLQGLAFVVHDGDFKNGSSLFDEVVFNRSISSTLSSALIFVPATMNGPTVIAPSHGPTIHSSASFLRTSSSNNHASAANDTWRGRAPTRICFSTARTPLVPRGVLFVGCTWSAATILGLSRGDAVSARNSANLTGLRSSFVWPISSSVPIVTSSQSRFDVPCAADRIQLLPHGARG